MDAVERRIRIRLRDNFDFYASKCLKVRKKSGEISNLCFNRIQKYLNDKVEQQKRETGKVRVIIVKGRQQGCSTYIEGRFYWLVTHQIGMQAFILTHHIDATNNLFEMAQRYHQYCPLAVQPQIEASNAKELSFAGLDSGYKLGTAGNKDVGRSATIQLLHGSEVGYWPNASGHAKGILQAVPDEKGTEIFIESTANGVGNYFHEQYQLAESGASDFIPIFLPWYWQEEYQKKIPEDFKIDEEEQLLSELYNLSYEQLAWRRSKIIALSAQGQNGLKSFMQEYPCNSTEAFQLSGDDNFFSPNTVMIARKCTVAEPYGPLIIGVDPARFGDDRTSIIRRRTRVAYNLQSYKKKDTMETVGIIHRIIMDEQPDKVCVDVGGLGAGIYDRLVELGHKDVVIAVNSSNTPLNQKAYFNKRAEMWGLMKEWLLDFPCTIPDNDSLHADLCGIKYRTDSNDRIKMESKQEMKKRGVRSPDEGDALALTFALPNSALLKSRQKEYDDLSKKMMAHSHKVDKLRQKAYKGKI